MLADGLANPRIYIARDANTPARTSVRDYGVDGYP
jgi:hypothetical protein